jgi:TatD DNase family protein|tara:strand:+ start:972 stop:1736 length:765 start_codon:yes stop_codon:yes gene_type:complete
MIDSHCHLDHEPLYQNLNEVILRSKDIGITKLLTICTNLNSFENIKKIINLDPIIYGTFGIHPHDADKDLISKNKIIENSKYSKKIIGIGETGLDLYYNNSDKKNQIKSFINHIEACSDIKKPLIVHSRSAEKETFDILNAYKNTDIRILMHCFTGSHDFARKLLNLNSYFSASGIITFKNSSELRNAFSFIPNEKIIIETDSPFLAPTPMRGKTNEPGFIKYTLEKLAEIKKLTLENMDEVTTNNFNTLFSVK